MNEEKEYLTRKSSVSYYYVKDLRLTRNDSNVRKNESNELFI